MVSTKGSNMSFTFHILCALAAFSMIVYCSYRFLLNEDVTEIGYKPMKDNYPDLTLCFYPPFLEHKLKAYGEDLKTWQYGWEWIQRGNTVKMTIRRDNSIQT